MATLFPDARWNEAGQRVTRTLGNMVREAFLQLYGRGIFMWGELFRDGSAYEIAQVLLLVAGLGFALMVPITLIAQKILFLSEPPDRRAFRTTGIAYGTAALVSIFGFDGFLSAWLGPIVPLPGAIAIFFWLRHDYRRGWIDDDKVPEGMQLENSDWRIGVVVVVAAITAATIKVFFIRA